MSDKPTFMGLMSAFPTKKEDSVKTPVSDKRFARPKGFRLDVSFEDHVERVFEENKVSMDILAK